MKIKRTLDDLGNHAFINHCFSDGIKVTKELGDLKPFSVLPSYKRKPFEEEYYQLAVSSSAATLLNACQQLTDSIQYLSSFSPSPKMKRHGITRQRHIQYTIENFIIRSQSTYDKLLVLVDAVFHLGNDDELINHQLIARNVHVRMTPVESQLRAIRKTMAKYQFVRNEIIHHGSFQEDDLRKLQGFSIIRESDSDGEFSIVFKSMTKNYLINKTVEYSEYVDFLFSGLYEIFIALDKVYLENRHKFIPNKALHADGPSARR